MRQAKVAEEREGAGDLSPLSSRFLPVAGGIFFSLAFISV